jgi:regulator of nucleoside diphosphate kinase
MEKRIVLSKRDVMRLRGLLRNHYSLTALDQENLLDLREEMDRASVVDEVPEDVVALDTSVLVRDVESHQCHTYTLVFPAQADLTEGRVSVLAPLGTALLGYRTGDEVEWWMPGGWRRLKIEAVMQPDDLPGGPPSQPSQRVAA